MKRIVLFILAGLLAADRAEAVCALPTTFVGGTRAVASEVNGNLTALQTCIVALQAADSTLSGTFANYLPLAGGTMTGSITLGGTATIIVPTGTTIAPSGSGNVIATIMSATGQIDDNDLAAGAVDGGTAGEIADDSITAADIATGGVAGAEILDDGVALTTDTAGNYVATVTGDSEITVSGAGTEGRAVTLAIDSTLTRDTELTAKSAASSTNLAIAKFTGTTGDLLDSGVTIDASNNVVTPGSLSAGGASGASTIVLRNTVDSGWVECGVVTTTWTCAVDADGTPDGTL